MRAFSSSTLQDTPASPDSAPRGRKQPSRHGVDVDIVIPVYNEESVLSRAVRRLHGFLSVELPFSWRIIIADNASTTRLARGARVTRGTKRELISRVYNALLGLVLRAGFSDAQCGFKAVRADILPGLLAGVRDDEWFFDTELLILAQRRGLRIHEVPVEWIEDPDSSVDIVATAMANLRGIARLSTPIARFIAVADTAANRRHRAGHPLPH